MKRICCLIFTIIMIVPTAVSCTSQTDTDDPDKINVVVTIFPQYDFVRAIAGDAVELQMLLSPESESHTYTPTLADIAMIGKADLFIYTGGGLDAWAEDIVASLGDEIHPMAISDAVTLTCNDESVHEHEHEHSHEHEHDHEDGACLYDEHVWTSPKNAIDIFDCILDALCEVDFDNAELYRKRAEAYRGELTAIDAELRELTSSAARREVIFADRFPFLYLTEEYGLDYVAALSGCSVGQEPTAGVIAELTEIVTSEGFGYVFVIENSNGKVAALIADATGCGVLTLHSCHTVSDEDYANGVTYVSLMKQNIENLRLALN